MKKIIPVLLISIFLISSNVFGKEKRDFLTRIGTLEFLQKNLFLGSEWVSYPDYSDRKAWEDIPAKIRNSYIAKGEKYLDFNWPTIPASGYLDFVRTGDREIMQRGYRERRSVFEALVMAELMEGKQRFLDQIINGVWVYCEQTYWGLSAHLPAQKAGAGLPDVNEPIIDLGVGFVGADLAWAFHFFKEDFDRVHPLISLRLKEEITKKVLIPYYERDDFWWQGFKGGLINNWNVWCNYNVLNCVMLIEEDSVVRVKAVNKVLRSVDQFINYYHEDGGCEEGPSYWGHAGGKLFELLELTSKITAGKINIFDHEVVKNIGRYIYRAYISDPYYINFADAEAIIQTYPGVIYRFGKNINDKELIGFGAFLAKKYNWEEKIFEGKIEIALENLFLKNEILGTKAEEPVVKEFWLSGTQIMGAREYSQSDKGFYFAAKGGYNDESHNHNDVGSFILYFDGKPCLVDVGVGTYTAKTFSSSRYEIWSMQSQYHNLPVINGVNQQHGRRFKARDCRFKRTPQYTEFSLDLARAYPKAAKVKKWKRSYRLNRGRNFVIKDDFELSEIKDYSSLHFMTCCQVKMVKEGILRLSGEGFGVQMKYDNMQFSIQIEEVKIDDSRIGKSWSKGLRRIILTKKGQALKGSSSLSIEKIN
ncbi:MAG: hypothetical protein COC06_06835 [Bacteroidales bacterium]|nr:MAG: hypothetical protein COC06_06835 [Bacteroidales bacterium]